MASLLVRGLNDAVKVRLKARARRHGRSLEAETRAILEEAAKGEPVPKEEKGFGTLMAELFGESGLTNEERTAIDSWSDGKRRRRTQFAKRRA